MPGTTVGLADGAEGLFIKNSRFNTTSISFNFYLPLAEDTVAAYALLPFILTTCSKEYPDFSRLNYKLCRLYGAQLSASTEKVGDYQLLKIGISVIDDKYTIDGEELCGDACKLLTSLIFEPQTENGSFLEADIEREKRKAIEHIRSEMSEKRIYAKGRLIEEMYKGKPYGAAKCGTIEQVSSVTGEQLFKAWEKMLGSAFVRVNVISSVLPNGLFDLIAERFSAVERSNITNCTVNSPTRKINKIKTVTDRMNVVQGKLVMGFSSHSFGDDTTTLPLLVMCDIFGGGPYSRLFANVREKMSLCYYCSASAVRTKGLITVDCGIEAANAQKAQEEILVQLEAVKKGEFTDFEFESSIKSISDSLRSYNDSQETLDTWYSIKIANKELLSPDEVAQRLSDVTRKQVIQAADGVYLNTVYKLLPEENK